MKNGNTSEVENGRWPKLDHRQARDRCNDRFDNDPRAARKRIVRLLRDFQIIVVEADHPEAQRDAHDDPDVGVGRVGPQQSRDQHAGKNHQATHRRRAGLGDEVRFRTIGADRLAFSLQPPQPINDELAEQKHKQQRGDDRAAGPERDVAKHIEDGKLVGKFDQPIKHYDINLVRPPFRERLSPNFLGARRAVAAP